MFKLTFPEHLRVDLNVHLHLHDEGARSTLRWVKQQLTAILENFPMAFDLNAITAATESVDTVDESVIALINELAAQVASLPADQAAIDALAARLRASADAMAEAVVANTPSSEGGGGTGGGTGEGGGGGEPV